MHTDGWRCLFTFVPSAGSPVADTLRVPAGMPAGCASAWPASQANLIAGPSSPTCDRLVCVLKPKQSARGQDRDLVQVHLNPRPLAQHTLACDEQARQAQPGADCVPRTGQPAHVLSVRIGVHPWSKILPSPCPEPLRWVFLARWADLQVGYCEDSKGPYCPEDSTAARMADTRTSAAVTPTNRLTWTPS